MVEAIWMVQSSGLVPGSKHTISSTWPTASQSVKISIGAWTRGR